MVEAGGSFGGYILFREEVWDGSEKNRLQITQTTRGGSPYPKVPANKSLRRIFIDHFHPVRVSASGKIDCLVDPFFSFTIP